MKKPAFFLVVISLIIVACSIITGTTPVPTQSSLTEISEITDPDEPIEVSAGEEFEIVIDSNPTTGYHWELVGELDANVVEFVSKDYQADQPVLIGSGGVDIWVFKAVGPGETIITLGYYPPSNDTAEPERMETFTISVQ